MDYKLLPKSFFQKNPLKEISAAMIAYFSMTDLFNERLQSKMEEILSEVISDHRQKEIGYYSQSLLHRRKNRKSEMHKRIW